jgi:hypothetical protein
MNTVFRAGRLVAEPARPARQDAFGLSRPLLLWAGVLALTMLSFYVHLLNEQMLRAQGLQLAPAASELRQARAAMAHSPARSPAATRAASAEAVTRFAAER